MTKDDIIDIVYLAAIVEAHSDKFPVPSHAEALAKRVVAACREHGNFAEKTSVNPYLSIAYSGWKDSSKCELPKDRPILAAWSNDGDPVSYGVVEYDDDMIEWRENGDFVGEPDFWTDFEKL